MSQTSALSETIRSVCVYCGSGCGTNPRYVEAARQLGKDLAGSNIRLTYGGGSNGLMGTVARAVMEHGGAVTGIIPESLVAIEKPYEDLNELVVTRDLHERKMLMFKRSDAFVALPGGIGTLEELVEQLTWVQLAHHQKPVVIVNTDDYWRQFLDLMEQMRAEGFIREGLEPAFHVLEEAASVVPFLLAHGSSQAVSSLDHLA
ncbi:TIGR00730 family Rossman fold protein [Dichotomicrobium thermohalophilum]|nr:TIGR00730 family Rossman fold protein [Dichotomicrobium thermohalophilum]